MKNIKKIRRTIAAVLALIGVFFLFGFAGATENGRISITYGTVGMICSLIWFASLTYLAGGFCKKKKETLCHERSDNTCRIKKYS